MLITAQDWDPASEAVANWLARQMHATYPQLRALEDAAAIGALMTKGGIAMIIDGLDEIDPDMQPVALRALSRQASSRIVILSRTTEMASAAARLGVLQGAAAIELQPVSHAEAASYLERIQLDPPPEGWHALTRQLRDNPAGPLGKALDSPLSLSLVRDTCQSEDDAREFLAFAAGLTDVPDGQGAEAITDYLLDRVLPAAYACQPGQAPPPYDLATAQNALTKIAAQMNHQNTRDLYWWHISTWAPRTQRQIVGGLTVGLTVGLALGLAVGFSDRLPERRVGELGLGLFAGLLFGLVDGLLAGVGSAGGAQPKKMTEIKFRKVLNRNNLIHGLLVAPLIGSFSGFLAGAAGGVSVGLAVGLGFGLVGGFAFSFIEGAADVATVNLDNNSSVGPTTSWRLNWNYTLTVMLAIGLGTALAIGIGAGFGAGLAGGLARGLAVGSGVGLGVGLAMGLGFGLVASEAGRLSSRQLR